jgi:hypothetical protein
MAKKPVKFDPRELLLQRARERLAGRQEGSGNYIQLPSGVFWKSPAEGENAFDFVPYLNTDEHHPDRVPVGGAWPRRPFWRHTNIGAEHKKVVCLKSVHRPCPICEERSRLIADGVDKKLSDALRPSYRELYLNLNEKDEFEIMEISYACFGKKLDRVLDRYNDDRVLFYSLESGFTVVAYFVESSMPRGGTFLEVDDIGFEKRDAISDDVIEDAPCLDEMLAPLTYRSLQALYLDVEEEDLPEGGEEQSGGADSEPTRNRRRSSENDEPETRSRRSGGGSRRSRSSDSGSSSRSDRRRKRESEDEDDDEPVTEPSDGFQICTACEGSRKNSRGKTCPICLGAGEVEIQEPEAGSEAGGGECPHGHAFGVDTDKKDECSSCDVWRECAEARDQADSGSSGDDEDKSEGRGRRGRRSSGKDDDEATPKRTRGGRRSSSGYSGRRSRRR